MIDGSQRSALATGFRRFAARECDGISPLYAALARRIAETPPLLDLAARARPAQPAPNMLFAAVHGLLLRAPSAHPLAGYYASLSDAPAPPDSAFAPFKDFCEAHEVAIAALLSERVVSTNEVRRCACLLPAFLRAADDLGEPLHLIEVGASAGLNLLWDHYAYDYDAAGRFGARDTPLDLACEVRGAAPWAAPPSRLPAVASRIGVDRYPLDPGDPEDAAWLRALIWPEQRDRADRLRRALALAADLRPRIIEGDGTARLAELFQDLPAEGTPCIYHSFTLNQFTPQARADFDAALRRLARARPLCEIALEWRDQAPAPRLTLARHDGPRCTRDDLAHCDAHGTWIDWLA